MAAENTTAHTEAAGRTRRRFPPFQKETFASQLFWLAICFVLLYLLMSRLALPRVAAIIDGAQRTHRRRPRRGEQAQGREPTQAIAAYEKALADARGRAQTIAQRDPRPAATPRPRRNRKAWKTQLNAKLAEAEKTIAATKTRDGQRARHRGRGGRAPSSTRLTGAAPPEATVAAAVDAALKR